MDVWFDSGSSHKSVLEARGETVFPADLYVEGFDQYRGWFNSSLITSTAVNGCAPYKQVISHGFALDGEGRKMSKSLGNTVDPAKVCNQLGADILRLWVASVDYGQDVRISDAILSQISEGYRKIRNTLRFFLGNLDGFDPATDQVAFAEMNELDRYAISGLSQLIDRVTKAYDNYEFNVVYQAIHHYCAVDMSAFYLDITKDRLYASGPQDQGRKAAQTVLYHVLSALTRLIAPVWRYIPGDKAISVQLTDLPNAAEYPQDAVLEQKWSAFVQVRDEIFKALEVARKDKVIGNSLGAHVDVYPSAEAHAILAQFTNLEELLIVSSGTVHPVGTAVPAEAIAFEGIHVIVTPASGEKCERCWMVLPEVGQDAEHPALCPRCASVVKKLG
jgi:isoleucyl-tRNA synthetase